MDGSCLWKPQSRPPDGAFVGFEGSDGPELLLGGPEKKHVGQHCAAKARVQPQIAVPSEVIYGDSHEERTH